MNTLLNSLLVIIVALCGLSFIDSAPLYQGLWVCCMVAACVLWAVDTQERVAHTPQHADAQYTPATYDSPRFYWFKGDAASDRYESTLILCDELITSYVCEQEGVHLLWVNIDQVWLAEMYVKDGILAPVMG
jgi:hypothetical protein